MICAICGHNWLRHHAAGSYCPIVDEDDRIVEFSDEKFMRSTEVPPGKFSINGSVNPLKKQTTNIAKDD